MTTERKPLLPRDEDFWDMAGYEVQEFYEDKITSGEIRVVTHVPITPYFEEIEWLGKMYTCGGFGFGSPGGCGASFMTEDSFEPSFCPKCGNPIQK